MKLFVSSPHHFYTKECRVKLTSYISPIDAQLKIKVCCNWRNKSSLWACQACLEFNVWIGRHDTAKANKKIITKEFEKKFNRFITAETFTLIDWAELVDHKNSFVPSLSTNDSKFTEIELNVEMKVKIISLAGYR
jgi:hypothetical protein